MNFPDLLLPSTLLWASGFAFAAIIGWAVYSAPWRHLGNLGNLDLLNVWLGTCVTLMLLWCIKAGIKPGLNFHLLGATLLTLMFGPQLAIVALTVVLLGVTLAGLSGWHSFALNMLVMALIPVAVSHTIYRFVDRKLPNHVFVYILLNAFAGGAIAMGMAGTTATLLLGASNAYSFGYLLDNYLPYYVLMSWSEALTTGMAATLMLAYRPQWLVTFSDDRYLKGK